MSPPATRRWATSIPRCDETAYAGHRGAPSSSPITRQLGNAASDGKRRGASVRSSEPEASDERCSRAVLQPDLGQEHKVPGRRLGAGPPALHTRREAKVRARVIVQGVARARVRVASRRAGAQDEEQSERAEPHHTPVVSTVSHQSVTAASIAPQGNTPAYSNRSTVDCSRPSTSNHSGFDAGSWVADSADLSRRRPAKRLATNP